MAVRKSKADKKNNPFGDLTDRERALQEQINQLEDFVTHGPERARKAEEERMQTLPPPSEIEDRKREKEFMKRLSRGEMANERREQAKNGLLIILLLCTIVAIGAWIYQTVFGS